MKPWKIARIKYTRKFLKSFSRLPHHIQTRTEERELIFKDNAFDSRLETHKLHGKDKENWAYSVDQNYRVKFMFQDDGNVLYINVGTHDEVY